ncbi:site-specific DNA-methyltransferase [Candidatus Nitrotoga sp. AM1P]|uniref:site-specific DNA-methyltransferase n=1 Tax=Candidatus Nitrotoga sp. AM1P TaxID=2559597 RepID=UPI0010B353EB|nr:site-specific DNA-methyltransferase [Candidatus Nitrotoga sp. AM1P]BBJ22702.1 site-specific DNA-methyltransferase [Candidatus Nitrotoga sp. AM1P]
MAKVPKSKLTVETIKHDEATRKNIPTAEYQSVMQKEELTPIRVAYERRNRDLDPQLVWHGKDEQDWSDLVVHAPPLYIQEKVHPKVLIDDLKRQTEQAEADKAVNQSGFTTDLFGDFNGLPNDGAKTEFYQHDAHWANRMILGDSLQVMASLAEREGLRGKVQCIYFDPPYGIKFNSNFQWSTTSRDVKDGNAGHITREPEQVKAFRDTWRDGIHSYLTYLRDRLTVARDLLTDSGSIFVQIGDENVHRVRAVMDEVFGEDNFVSTIAYAKTTGFSGDTLSNVADYMVWFAKKKDLLKYRDLYTAKQAGEAGATKYREISSIQALRNSTHERTRLATSDQLTSQGESSSEQMFPFAGRKWTAPKGLHWKTTVEGLIRTAKAERIMEEGASVRYVRCLDDFAATPRTNLWLDIGGVQSRTDPKIYVVQTATEAVQRCVLMTTDPGDLVLDPTCGSGTTAYVSEQWGRRWITIDTSRVALALARARIMGARYPYYLLADSRDGQIKESEVTRTVPSSQPTRGNIRQGFVYERVPHITLKSIANNTEIDVIWDKWQQTLESLREQLNKALGKQWQEWEIPRELPKSVRPEPVEGRASTSPSVLSTVPAHPSTGSGRTATVVEASARTEEEIHREWWSARIARQKEIDASIAAKAEHEYLYDKPYEDKKKVRVAGPFTVESLSPHRVLAVDENDELIDGVAESKTGYGEERDFVQMILENLKTAGVQQAHKEDKITFTTLTPWPGDLVCAEGKYLEPSPLGRGQGEGGVERRAAIFIGPEFGTVSRPDLVSAAREAGDSGFDVLITCAFNYDAHSSEFDKLGRIPVLKARMNADLHMADDLKNTGKGNLFVIFGEPDIDILDAEAGQVRVKINGVDVFHPNTGEVRSDGAEGIACWFIDTDYNEESFFVRHAYFLGANDPYKALRTTLKAEINEDAWASLNSDTSRPFDKPKSGRIAVKVINHLGDEVMKVFKVV